MQALSPRSANIQVKPGKKDQLEAKAAAVRKAQREREHPPQPPEEIREPNNTRGEPGLRYRTGKYLGKGGFAVCYEGELLDRQSRSTGQKYALKIVKSQMSQKKMEEKVKNSPSRVNFLPLIIHCSFGRNFKYTPRCTIPILWNSIEHSPLVIVHSLS